MFKLEIIDINENINNILLTDNLTIESLKIKYNWFLKCVKNCIVGEDENGFVWYSGEWICGEWESGTWYSGIWHDGTWKNGKWYSYLLDNVAVLSEIAFIILEKDKKYSEFRSGNWLQGDFYDGIFGYDRDISNKALVDVTGKTFSSAYWSEGKFHNGLFKNSVWLNGVFYNGEMMNSYWVNGRFYNGTFSQYEWYNGHWYGGDFKQGNWRNGIFDQINNDIKSRFGTDDLIYLPLGKYNTWNGGTFANGEFHSGLNLDSSGNTLPSLNNKLSQWLDGDFTGGKWYGGHFLNGNFSNGNWYGGVFNTNTGPSNYTNCTWNSGNWYNGLWINGTFKSGHFYDGMWLDGIFEYGYLSSNTVEGSLLPKSSPVNVNLPSVVTYSATTITDTSTYCNGRVTNNGGGSILDRGVCLGFNSIDLITDSKTPGNSHSSDGGTMGNFSIKMSNLTQGTTYHFRAYAINKTGTTYGETYNFDTTNVGEKKPSVNTYDADIITANSARLNGPVNWNNNTITEIGFYYGLYNDPSITGSGMTIPTIQGGFITGTTTGITSGTTYYYLAYAINGLGTTYGNLKNFTTTDTNVTIPIVTTDSVSNIYGTTASICGSNTTGQGSIIERGICWATTSNPNTGDTTVVVAIGEGVFCGDLTGLITGTTYHARAYAKNSAGTGYGIDIEFKTKNTPSVIVLEIIPL